MKAALTREDLAAGSDRSPALSEERERVASATQKRKLEKALEEAQKELETSRENFRTVSQQLAAEEHAHDQKRARIALLEEKAKKDGDELRELRGCQGEAWRRFHDGSP